MSHTITLLHPGNMGVTIGAAAATSGARVVWVSRERSEATRKRAGRAELVDLGSLDEALGQSDMVLAVCPPHAAVDVAEQVAAKKFKGVYVDANAVSRATAERIGEIVSRGGASFVDGGIIGSPVKQAGTTRLYLSGARAPDVAELFSKSMLDARAIGPEPGAASALKVAYAAWTKGTDAMLLAIRCYAAHDGQGLAGPGNGGDRAAAMATPKAWRYVGEMEEIAEAFEKAGLPGGFHKAAAELCERLESFKDRTDPAPTIAEVVETLRGFSEGRLKAAQR